MDERHHILTGLPGLDNVEEATLAALARCFELRSYTKVELCREGDPADRLWVLGAGQVSVSRQLSSRRPCEVAILRPTTLVGFSGLMGITNRSATLQAAGTIDVLEMTTEDAVNLLDQEGSRVASAFRRVVIAAVGRQVSTSNANIAKLAVEVGLATPVITEEDLLAAQTLH